MTPINDDRTPTTEDVREAFRRDFLHPDDLDLDDTPGRAFDRWLAAHDAALLARVRPSREDVARALCAHDDAAVEWRPRWDDPEIDEAVRDAYRQAADVVLALWPGRTEAAVKAVALREAADAFEGAEIRVEVFGDSAAARWLQRTNDMRRHFVASLRDRADQIEKEADRG